MICNVSPNCAHYQETYSALEFSNKSKNIVNNVTQCQASLFENEEQRQLAKKMMNTGYSASGTVPGFEILEQHMNDHNVQRINTAQPVSSQYKEELAKVWNEVNAIRQKVEFNNLMEMNTQLKIKNLEKQQKESPKVESIPKTPPHVQAPMALLTPSSRATEAGEFIERGNKRIAERDYEKALYCYIQANLLDSTDKRIKMIEKLQRKVDFRKRREVHNDGEDNTEPIPATAQKRRSSGPEPSRKKVKLVQEDKENQDPVPSKEKIKKASKVIEDEEEAEYVEEEHNEEQEQDREVVLNKLLLYINNEQKKKLIKLAFVGEKTADKILSHRPFKSLDDLSKIGLSSKKLIEKNLDNELLM